MSASPVSLVSLELSAVMMLRGDAGGQVMRTRVREFLGLDTPARTGLVTTGKGWRVLCLGPDQWLALSDREACVAPQLRAVLLGEHAAVIDMKDALLAARLQGPRAGDVLARGCAVDLHPRSRAWGGVLQTLYRRANLIVLPDVTGPAFDLLVERSFAPYVWEHIRQDAALMS